MNKGTRLLVSLGIAIVTDYASIISAQSLSNRAPVYATIVPQGGNSISGHVFSNSRQPVADVYVELLDEVNASIGTPIKTNGSGFYAFRNLTQGTFKVRVRPYGTEFAEQTQEVMISNISIIPGGGRDSAQLDIYLRLRPNADSGPFAAPGVIFVQEVPVEAKKLYEVGITRLREKKEKEGFESLKRSLEIFPNYYLALDRLGTEYVTRGYYEAAFILLRKAVEVNASGFSSVFGVGVAQYNLKQINEAIENLRRATTLYSKSANAQLWLGLAYKRAGKLEQSEAALKRANELSKGKAAEIHWQIARLYSEQKRYKEAADELELYLKYQSDKSDTEKIKQLIQQLREKAVKQ